jgi:hypothetical protein
MDVDHPMIEFDEGNSPKMDFNFSVEDVPMLEDLAAPFSPAVGQSDAGIQRLMQTPKKRKVCPGFIIVELFLLIITPGSESAAPSKDGVGVFRSCKSHHHFLGSVFITGSRTPAFKRYHD